MWNGIHWLAGILAPCCSVVSGPVRVLRWLVHLVLVGLVLVGLWHLNSVLGVEKLLRSPWPILHQAWLPLLFLLVYLLAWLSYGLWRLLAPPRTQAEFPDVEAAWAKALRALQEGGIGLDRAPLFLILGRPARGLHGLIHAAGMRLTVPQTPAAADAPVHVFANHDAIFVSCSGCALVSSHEDISAENIPRTPEDAAAQSGVTDEGGARLAALCRLIARDRRPYCPINGVLVLIPLSAAQADVPAGQVGLLAQRDIRCVHQTLQVECPVFVLLCDLEQAPGFADFVQQMPKAQRRRPLGHAFPLMPDIDPHEIQGVVEGGVDRLFQQVVPDAIFKCFRLEEDGGDAGGWKESVRSNAGLYRLLAHLRLARQRTRHIVYRGTQVEVGTLPMLAGCYLVATGPDPERDQAFVAEVFQEVIRHQNFVAWSPRALAEEARYRRVTRVGYVGLAGLIVAVGALGYFIAN